MIDLITQVTRLIKAGDLYNHITSIIRVVFDANQLWSTRVAMGDQQARIRDEGVCLKGPAAVAKLLNCRYQHNTSAGVDRERQLLDRTITRIRRTLTSRASDIIAHGTGMVFHVINLVVMVLMPMVVIHVKDSGFSLVGAMYVCMLYAILFLKLWSYIQVNMWCRLSNRKKTTQGRMRRQLSYNNLQYAARVTCNGFPLRMEADRRETPSAIQQSTNDVSDFEHEINDCGNSLVQYPDNLSLGDLYYYILAPTLCYELNFPRTQRIRKRFLIKRILEVVVGCQVVMSLFQQWMIPSVKNSLIPFSGSPRYEFPRDKIRRKKGAVACATVAIILLQVTPVGNISVCDITLHNITSTICEWKETKGFSDTYKVYFFHSVNNFVARIRSVSINMDVAKASERLLKLAIPNHLVWLCFFYLTFHSFLNLLGELLHFADRNFYSDWWNANNIDTFWRTWNAPVHRWAVRHLYIPVVEMGYGKTTAALTVFFISAFFHEYLVSVPLRTFKIWAFMGMMGQIPLSVLSKMAERYCGARWGNIVVWASLIIGQPLCIMMYYHDYVVTHFGETLLEDYSVV
ncbi:Diacylglycerol O-acyltransferase 1 [Trachymyrmex cornetzi]|uniref:O-acyltransferase n=1 Tax=Trachymyrmex cornetzi TaxID=471704 RepID=A0A151J3I5_9HYME|nr:Diacylglycerol O-acyltransferase 1 [Trachymyrmex cornetzi]